MILFARPLMVVIVLSSAFSLLDLEQLEQLVTQTWGHVLVAMVSFGVFGFGFWRWRRSGGKCTSAMTFAWITYFLMILGPNFDLSFGSQFHGAFWDSFSTNWSFMILPFLFLSAILVMRESKKTMPWRQMQKYSQNPVAAEETYRLSPKIGLALGTASSCICNLSMVRFFGLTHVIVTNLVFIVLAYLYARFIMGREH